MGKEKLFQKLSDRKQKITEQQRTRCHYSFKNRSHGRNKMVMVLTGYKEYLYAPVFGRFRKYLSKDLDVCIITSGKYVETIDQMCEKEGWSYLSTKENHVSLVQNTAIRLHPKAQYIYKLDEDIFICEGYFERMMEAYKHAGKGPYIPGVIAPLIPVNGYGHVRILEKLGLTEQYTKLFEQPVYAAGPDRMIENNAEVAKFFWGEGGYVPGIDEINRRFYEESKEERPCPIRFSIGAVLFERKVWETMHFFTVNRRYPIGTDEEDLCAWCVNSSRPLMVSENIVVGHFSFGPQNAAMREYFDSHSDVW